jgi:lysyl-tRNA synthetase class 2
MAEPRNDSAEQPDFLPTASIPMLKTRARLLRRVRAFFDDRGFFEVDTPLLSRDTIVDHYLDPLPVTVFRDPQDNSRGETYWLQTSPEFAMKRLLAAGAERIYQITRAFRSGESGTMHNPEFTIVEWYRVGDTATEGMELLGEMARTLLLVEQVDELSYRDAFQNTLGIDPHRAPDKQLAALAAESRTELSSSKQVDRDNLLNALLSQCIEPQLGMDRPVILFDYPASQAALAEIRRTDPPVAARFELYYRGIELANGYQELRDPDELLRRNIETNQLRDRDGKYRLPEQSRLQTALQAGIPPCSGVALGFDRLVMLATDSRHIDQVMPFPIDRA